MKIYNLFRQKATRQQITFDKYLPYFDKDNDNWPLTWHQAISESSSGSSCVSTIADFLEGAGFSDKDLEKRIVNSKGETFFQIHQKTCRDFSEFEGFYWLQRYNALGQTTEWEFLSFENCRLGKPDDNGYISKIYYNPFFGTSQYSSNKKDTVEYDVYNPKVVKEQILAQGDKFKGQVFFFGTTTPQSRFYPMHEAFSAFKWLKVEAGIGDYHQDNINNGFLQPFMLAMIGNPDDPISNPEGDSGETPTTKGEELDEVIQNNFMGAKRVGTMWVNWYSNKDEIPVPIAMPANNNGDLFVTIDNQATKKITIAFKVPSVLANINEGVSLGGDGNMVRVAVKLMQQRSIKKQRILTDSYSRILRNFSQPYTQDITIVPYNPYPELEILDDKIWQEMSPEERRKWINENTPIELGEAVVESPGQPAPTQARVLNAVPVGFPEPVRNKVKKTLDYMDKMGIKCGGKGGMMMAEAIMNNQNLGLKQLKRIHSYLRKNEQFSNSLLNEGCNVIEYNAWGGKEMFDFLESKLKEIDQWLN